MCAIYLGPLIVISHNKGGAYTVAELDGSVFDCPIADFHVIPYFARTTFDIPPLSDLIDISNNHLKEMEDSKVVDPDNEKEVEDPLLNE